MPSGNWHECRPFRITVAWGQKAADGVGTTTGGKGSKVMAVAEGNSLPIGLYVNSARPHESQLPAATPATVRAPQGHGHPRTRPREPVEDKAYDSHQFRWRLCRRNTKLTIPTLERRKRHKPERGRPILPGASYRQRWKVECNLRLDG
jgi:hypothetical protein